MSTFEDILSRDRILVYKTQGVSMRPMLRQNRDLVIIKPAGPELKPMDVALYKSGGRFVLHRIIHVKDGYYLIRGDNTYSLEKVPYSAVIGVLTGFRRNGKQYSANDRKYLLYARFWNAVYPLRHFLFRMRKAAGRAARKLGLR